MITILIYIALIVYCTIAFGIHGGEMLTGTNRQLRNMICAAPFGVVCFAAFGWLVGLTCLGLAYGGVSLTFDSATLPRSQPTTLWLIAKGMITCPFGGIVTLPIVYWLSYKTRWTNVLAEYASGAAYGLLLVLTMVLKGVYLG